MRTDTPIRMRLEDYSPYPFAIDTVDLTFDLDPRRTQVKARMTVRRVGGTNAPLELDGQALTLNDVAIDGRSLEKGTFELDDTHLRITNVPDRFTLTTDVTISPEANTALSGLYMSGGRFCTQCEAEGFRRITFWPDRPDVMSRFRVRLTADARRFPILLSNGSPAGTGSEDGGRHWAEWDDPHPKPSYLFALCAGDYDALRDTFTTMNGRKVDLAIYVDKGDAPRAAYAMDSLKRSMRWDEQRFGREYDLDVFNIVAVRDFNFGAMENKGLNIFNSAYVLADAETATDADFEAIESIVAHEYFHNWTGNRITCRDWFQLCLKEGLTVFRDQEFSAEMRSRPVQRIKDVIRLRARQFPEDGGPLAHAVRPTELASIDNLYTATVYEKGAELIRMLRQIIGEDAFSSGMTLYFNRHDGQAVTIEDFYACFAEASGRDLSDFLVWYAQPGTPNVAIEIGTPTEGAVKVTALQTIPATPGQSEKRPLPMPIRLSVFNAESGEEWPLDGKPVLTGDRAEFSVPVDALEPDTGLLVSFNRGFAAPIRTETRVSRTDLIRLAEIDTDPFNQWDATQTLLRELILEAADSASHSDIGDHALGEVISAARTRFSDPALAALLLRVPTVPELFMERDPAHPTALQDARDFVRKGLANHFADDAHAILTEPEPTPFKPDAVQAGVRALRGSAMALLSARALPQDISRLHTLFKSARSMTESLSALMALVDTGSPSAGDALADFYVRWKSRPTVIDKWFSVQALSPRGDVAARVRRLTEHTDFDLKNPNRVRSVLASFATQNLAAFHAPDGSGHRLLADIVRDVDALNPALSARLLTAFEQWRRLEPAARDSAQQVLNELTRSALSRNASDIASRALG